jgi:hypothetical protein
MSGKMEGFMLPTDAPAHALANAILIADLPENLIQQRVQRIQRDLLAHSNYLREPDFKVIHARDLEFLFGAYDEQFFAGLCRGALDGKRLDFRLSRRMTRAGGKTSRYTTRVGEVTYEISIASTILFDGFGGTDRLVTVCGIEQEPFGGTATDLRARDSALGRAIMLGNQQLRRGALPGHSLPLLPPSSPHPQSHHAA